MRNIAFAGAKKRKIRHLGYVFRTSQRDLHSTQMGRPETGLLSLADELLVICIENIEGHQERCNLAATCARFQGLVEPKIWQSLLVLSGTHAQRITNALDSREERLDHIREISIRYKADHKAGIEALNHHLSHMSKLRHFTLESPCPNNSEWRNGLSFDGSSRIDFYNLLASAVYPRLGMSLSLPALQSLTLHAHGPAFQKFVLGRAKAMFLHPTLRHITMSCLDFEEDLSLDDDIVKRNYKSTPLRSLTLIECNVDVRFLDVVLSLPKALEELSIGERLHAFPECEPSTDPVKRTTSPLFLTALQRQAGSLKRLSHIGGLLQYMPERQNDPEGSAKLRSLSKLEDLELGFESNLYHYLRNDGFPPMLKKLKMLDSAIAIGIRNLQAMSNVAFNSLTSLVTHHLPVAMEPDFVLHLRFSDQNIFGAFHLQDEVNQNHIVKNMFIDRPKVYKIATVLKSYRSKFYISREMFPSGIGYIPPYMYGEEVPVEEMMYDSDEYWRFSGVDFRIMDDEKLREELKGKKKLDTCLRCTLLGSTVEECHSLKDGSPCLPCRRERSRCEWTLRSDEEDEQEV